MQSNRESARGREIFAAFGGFRKKSNDSNGTRGSLNLTVLVFGLGSKRKRSKSVGCEFPLRGKYQVIATRV